MLGCCHWFVKILCKEFNLSFWGGWRDVHCFLQKVKEKKKKERKSRRASSENLQTTNAGEGVEKREPSCTVGGNVNWCSYYGKQYGGSSKKLKIKLPYDPAVPLLEYIFEEKTTNLERCMNPMFIADYLQ